MSSVLRNPRSGFWSAPYSRTRMIKKPGVGLCGAILALNYCSFGSYHLRQAIIRIVVVNRCGGDQLVLHKNGRRDRTLVQDVEADSNNVLAIPFRKVCDRSYKASLGLAQLRSALGRSVLPHDGAVLSTTRFLKRAQSSQSTGVIDAANQRMPGMRRSQMSAHRFKAGT